jgi:dihydrofolate reductase
MPSSLAGVTYEMMEAAVQQLKREAGRGLLVGGVKLPLALAELGLIDEYEFVVQPRLAGHGPTLFAGLSKHVDLKLVSRLEFGRRRRQGFLSFLNCIDANVPHGLDVHLVMNKLAAGLFKPMSVLSTQ